MRENREVNSMGSYPAVMMLGYYQEPIAVEKIVHATEEEITKADLALLRYMKANAKTILSSSATVDMEPINFKRKER